MIVLTRGTGAGHEYKVEMDVKLESKQKQAPSEQNKSRFRLSNVFQEWFRIQSNSFDPFQEAISQSTLMTHNIIFITVIYRLRQAECSFPPSS